jgi:hypothetical protein
MTFANLPGVWVIAGLATLAAALFVLQQLRTRYRDVTVVTTIFWRQVKDEAPVRTLRERFRHPWAYALVLAIALVWLSRRSRIHPDGRWRVPLLVLDGSAGMAATILRAGGRSARAAGGAPAAPAGDLGRRRPAAAPQPGRARAAAQPSAAADVTGRGTGVGGAPPAPVERRCHRRCDVSRRLR